MEQQLSYLTELEFNPVLASAGKRFLNYLIDIIIFDIIVRAVESLFALGIVRYGMSDYYSAILIGLLIAYIGFVVLYFISELALKGRTIGKFVTGTKAVNEDGTEMQPKTILIRSLCRIVPFEPLSAFGGYPWHDKWSKTYVIDVRKTELNNLSVQ